MSWASVYNTFHKSFVKAMEKFKDRESPLYFYKLYSLRNVATYLSILNASPLHTADREKNAELTKF